MSHKRWEIKLLSHTKLINVLSTPFKETIKVLYFKDILRLKDDKKYLVSQSTHRVHYSSSCIVEVVIILSYYCLTTWWKITKLTHNLQHDMKLCTCLSWGNYENKNHEYKFLHSTWFLYTMNCPMNMLWRFLCFILFQFVDCWRQLSGPLSWIWKVILH